MQIQTTKPIRALSTATAQLTETFRAGVEELGILPKDTAALGALSDSTLGYGLGAAATMGAAAYPSIWAHEMGHAKTIEMLYEGAKPTVEVFPFKGGVTKWYPGPLSDMGQKLGEDVSRGLVSASGTLVDMGIATATFGAGFKLRKKHPIAGHALMAYGGLTVLNSIGYAATAVGGNLVDLAKTGNDFASIGLKLGIPPLASIAILASILPLEYAILRALESEPKKVDSNQFGV